MEIESGIEGTANASAVDDGSDSWSDTSGDYSVVSDGGPSSSTKSTTEEVPKGQLKKHFTKGGVPKRRFTHCPEKKKAITHMEGYSRRVSRCSKSTVKRGRCLRSRLETIFEHPIVAADKKIVFFRRRHYPRTNSLMLVLNRSCMVGLTRRNYNTSILDNLPVFAGRSQLGANADKMAVEEVDQLMMNLDIHQESPVV